MGTPSDRVGELDEGHPAKGEESLQKRESGKKKRWFEYQRSSSRDPIRCYTLKISNSNKYAEKGAAVRVDGNSSQSASNGTQNFTVGNGDQTNFIPSPTMSDAPEEPTSSSY